MTTDLSQPPAPDVRDMLAVHGALRDTLVAAPGLFRSLQPGDTDRGAMLQNFYVNIMSLLHGHHDGEESLLFPKLAERCADERDLVARIAAQHHDVETLMQSCTTALDSWNPAHLTAGAELGALLGELGAGLEEHFEEEERAVLPLAAVHLSAPEWGELPGHAMRNFTGDKLWLILGLINERMTPSQRASMMVHMPPPVAEMWTNVGVHSYAALMEQVGAPLR
jgi:hypothetical protein